MIKESHEVTEEIFFESGLSLFRIFGIGKFFLDIFTEDEIMDAVKSWLFQESGRVKFGGFDDVATVDQRFMLSELVPEYEGFDGRGTDGSPVGDALVLIELNTRIADLVVME